MSEVTMLSRLMALGCRLTFDVAPDTGMLRLHLSYRGMPEYVYQRNGEVGASALITAAWYDFGRVTAK